MGKSWSGWISNDPYKRSRIGGGGRCFAPAFLAAGKSAGLGLAIAGTRIEQMNDTITAKYENGRLRIYILFSCVGSKTDELKRTASIIGKHAMIGGVVP